MATMAESNLSTIDGLTPRTIETPADYETVARILKQASDTHCTVVPYGGGTTLDLGAPLQQADLVMSLEKLNRVLDHQPANLTVRAEAGITLAALNQALAREGQFLPLDPPFPDRATIGGILAANASGPLRVRFGSARDLVIGVRVALADGQIVRGGGDVVKNVAGYDLPKLFIGSLGTLGILTEATFKLAPLPPESATFAATFASLRDACEIAQRVLHSPLLPTGVEILNPRASAELGVGEGYALLVRFGGLKSAVGQQLREVEQWARERGATAAAVNQSDDALWAQLRDFIFAKPVVVKIGVLPTYLDEVAAEAERLAVCTFRAHALGILYAALQGETEATMRAIKALREFVTTRKGQLVVQRAPRELRERVDVWGPPRPDFAVMQKLKQEFDPNGALNPGRFVGGI
jgi:glycolate dehydrogenase FAD-binding subunit